MDKSVLSCLVLYCVVLSFLLCADLSCRGSFCLVLCLLVFSFLILSHLIVTYLVLSFIVISCLVFYCLSLSHSLLLCVFFTHPVFFSHVVSHGLSYFVILFLSSCLRLTLDSLALSYFVLSCPILSSLLCVHVCLP